MAQRFVLLDRDGVINDDSMDFIKTPDEWLPIPGSLEAIALLNDRGYEVAVVTNQSGLARGLLDEAVLQEIHGKMSRLLAEQGGRLCGVYYCPHGPDSTCDCRKPKPGLLLQFASEHSADLTETFVVGDSLRDLEAAEAVGAKPVLVQTGKGQATHKNNPNLHTPVFADLYDAVQFILASE